MFLRTDPQVQAAVERRSEGRDRGAHHSELAELEQQQALAGCVAGLVSTQRSEVAYWHGYAETAWSIAKAISMQPLDGLYGFLPHAKTCPGACNPFVFISSYQGETEYQALPEQKLAPDARLRFRWARCPWQWSFQKTGRYWNYESHEAFELQFNDAHGLLMRECAEPVDVETLRLFQQHVCPVARTGYYCHHRNRFVECPPTRDNPSRDSYNTVQKQTKN